MQTWQRISRVRPETVWPAADALERDPPTTAHVLWSPAQSGHLCRFTDAYPAGFGLDCAQHAWLLASGCSEPAADTGTTRNEHDRRDAGLGKGHRLRDVCISCWAGCHVRGPHAGDHWNPGVVHTLAAHHGMEHRRGIRDRKS